MKTFFQIVFLFLSLGAYAQIDTVGHMQLFGGGSNDVAEEISATSDGGFMLVGSTSSSSWGNTDAYLIKVDSNCNHQWSKAIGGANNDWGYSVKQTFDKGYIVALSTNSYGKGGYDACLMKRDSLGNFEWTKTYGGNDWDFAYSVVQTYDSGYVFCGETYSNSAGFSDVYIVKTNNAGDTVWTKTMGGTLVDKGNAIIETSDSNLVVAAMRNTSTDSTQIYLIKLKNDGTLLWDSLYGDSLYETAHCVLEASNGDYVVGGSSTSLGSDLSNYILRTDNNGNTIFGKYYNSNGEEEIYSIIEDPYSNLVCAGYTDGFGNGKNDVHVFVVDIAGWWLWRSATYGYWGNEKGKSIAIAKKNTFSFAVAGFSDGLGNGLEDALLICLDTVYSGQPSTIDTVVNPIPLNIPTLNDGLKIKIYPNPASSSVVLEMPNQANANYSFRLLNILGEELMTVSIKSGSSNVNLEKFVPGMYLVQVVTQNQIISSSKLIIE